MSIINNITFTARYHHTKDGLITLMISIVYNIMIMFVLTPGTTAGGVYHFPATPEHLYKYKLF